jgi:hypothetical protein
MIRGLRTIVLIVLSIAVSLSIASASALSATLPGCTNPAEPALNQYCDSVPSATGPQTPGPGGPVLSTPGRQPGASVGQGAAGTSRVGAGSTATVSGASIGSNQRKTAGQAGERLRALPAPATHHVVLNSGAPSVGGGASFASVSTWMIAILGAVAAALAATALVRRRPQDPGTS